MGIDWTQLPYAYQQVRPMYDFGYGPWFYQAFDTSIALLSQLGVVNPEVYYKCIELGPSQHYVETRPIFDPGQKVWTNQLHLYQELVFSFPEDFSQQHQTAHLRTFFALAGKRNQHLPSHQQRFSAEPFQIDIRGPIHRYDGNPFSHYGQFGILGSALIELDSSHLNRDYLADHFPTVVFSP